jgi:hypothetical protein
VNDEVVIICPELKAGAGGLADYTLRVVESWPTPTRLRFIVPRNEDRDGGRTSSLPNVTIVDRRKESLLAALPTNGGGVLVQYSGYGFDRIGYPRWLLAALTDWKARARGLLVVMFHEVWTFWPVLNKNYFVQQLHRRDIRTLVARADAVFTTTASQAEHLRRLARQCRVNVLPVGSNVRPITQPGGERHAGVAVLFGLAATRRRALETMRDDLATLATSGALRKIVTVGARDQADVCQCERTILAGLPLCDGFEQRGAMPEDEVSRLLSSAVFGISAQDDLSITKSGTFMAYAAHGLNVISPFASAGKPEPLCWLTAPHELINAIAPEQLRERAERLRGWQQRTASWPKIAAEFARALRLADPIPA